MFERWPKTTASMAALVLVAAVAHFIYQGATGRRRPEGQIWYYNLKTQELFTASDLSVPPIDTKSGPATGVRAYVYVPEDRPDPTNRFIAFLETLTPELKREVEQDLKNTGQQLGIGFGLEKKTDGILVSSPDVIAWVPKFSPEGIEIMEAGKAKGGTAGIKPCLP
jgi:hypothetical protein